MPTGTPWTLLRKTRASWLGVNHTRCCPVHVTRTYLLSSGQVRPRCLLQGIVLLLFCLCCLSGLSSQVLSRSLHLKVAHPARQIPDLARDQKTNWKGRRDRERENIFLALSELWQGKNNCNLSGRTLALNYYVHPSMSKHLEGTCMHTHTHT